jgi:ankyrin repeat protein
MTLSCLLLQFRPYVQAYAEDEQLFFKDFAEAFAALLAKGCPASVQPASAPAEFAAAATADGTAADVDKDFRDLAMHGSLERMKALEGAGGVNVNSVEAYSKRTALHKAAFFGHAHVVEYLLGLGADPNARDADGDAPLHDAARLGHAAVVRALLAAGADRALTNADGKTPSSLAAANDKTLVVEALA